MACKPEEFRGDTTATGALRWIEEMDTTVDFSGCRPEEKIRFASQSLKGEAHIWWKKILNTWGREKALNMGWRKFCKVFFKKYVSGHEVEQLEDAYFHLKMEGTNYRKYTSRFFEISGLIPDFAGSESKKIGRFMCWRKFCKFFFKKYVSGHEAEQLEDGYLHLKMEGTNYCKYTS
jgi:hypothetical protein